jgi:PAS domain-containing protein
LHILSKQPKVFAEEDIEFFKTMARQVAIAIENARLFEETYQKTIQLEEKVVEINKAKIDLEESERQFRDLVENSPFGILIVQNNQIVYQNPLQKKLFKPLVPPSDFEGLLKTIHPDDLFKINRANYS